MDLPEEIRSKLAELDLELSEGKSYESSSMDIGFWKRGSCAKYVPG